jgi:hypothetical protein
MILHEIGGQAILPAPLAPTTFGIDMVLAAGVSRSIRPSSGERRSWFRTAYR